MRVVKSKKGWFPEPLQLCFINALYSHSLLFDSSSASCGTLMTFFHSVKRCVCYMVCAGEATGLSQSRRSSGLEIGCLIDTDTGLLTFTSNGVEMSAFFQVGLPRNYLIGNKLCLSYSSSSKFPISLFPFSFHKYEFYTADLGN